MAALGSALLWAISAVLFSRLGVHMSAISMNIGKGIVALVFMGLLIVASGFEPGDVKTVILLGVSGLVGICLGDTLYFLTLVRLGSRLTLLLGSLIPLVTGLIAGIFLGESITLLAWLGILLTLFGVTYVLWERSVDGYGSKQWQRGLIYGLLFVLANALGIIFTKLGVQKIPSLDASFIRQAVAIGGFVFWGILARQWTAWLKPLMNPRYIKMLLLASLIGAFLGTWLSVVALKYTHATVATVLNSTSPLFILPIAIWVLKEKVSVRAIVGAAIAVVGVAIYFMSIK